MRKIPGDRPAPTPAPAPVDPTPRPAHHSDPVLARALFAAWSGDPATVIASPPGAGKTRLITELVRELTGPRAGLDVAIAAQTRAQALDVANRAAALGAAVTLLGKANGKAPAGLHPGVQFCPGAGGLRARHGVVVATTARWQWTPDTAFRADVLAVDEAWQMTYADLGALGPLADQVVLVGDPGQIAPVVTADTSRWDAWAAGPHLPAPQALVAAYPDHVTSLRLPHSWRLGPATTALIQPAFYADLPFTSARPDRHLTHHGERLPEIGVATVDTVAGPSDPSIPEAAAARVRTLLTDAQVHSDGQVRALGPDDVAVVVPHVSQAALICAHLADLPQVLVGTANQLQGTERDAVVVVHPLAGYRQAPAFAMDAGRLCVALSRHRCHATVIIDTGTAAVLDRARAERPHDQAVTVQQSVLANLLGAGQPRA